MNSAPCSALARLAAERDLLRDVADSLDLARHDPPSKREVYAAIRARLKNFAAVDPVGAAVLLPALARDLTNAANWKRWHPAWGLASAVEKVMGGMP